MKALIAMSGGVDSSVAAYLAQREGYECIGCTMKLYTNTDAGISERHTCCSLDDVEDARAVAYRLGMRYCVFNFSEGFREQVMLPFCEAYRRARTPNPCIECNKHMKFDKLHLRAKTLGYDYVATGHYARISQENGKYVLKKALDPSKDQSYVLYAMDQEQLAHTLFPLGELHKDQVRAIAEKNGFINAHKRESQDICFVPDGDYGRFLREYGHVEMTPGDFVDREGRVLGRHKGLPCYTTGQRKGLGVSAGRHVYVVRKNAADNTILLGDNEELYARELTACRVNWISGTAPTEPVAVTAKTRYSQTEAEAEVTPLPEGRMRVVFRQPQRAITSGQAVVLYDGDTVLGGGVIEDR